MLNLFDLAESNSSYLQEKFNSQFESLNSADADVIHSFADWIKTNGLISINVKPYLLVKIIEGDQYENIYEWSRKEANRRGVEVDVVLRDRLKDFYEKRMKFDHSFKDGEKFRYGALNAGGTGLTKYGQYCMVLNEDFRDVTARITYVDGDSLMVCLRDNDIDTSLINNIVSSNDSRHLLVATSRSSNILSNRSDDWYLLVSDGTNYFEAIFIGKVDITTIKKITMKKSEFDRMWDFALSFVVDQKDDAERALVKDFLKLNQANSSKQITLEVI